MLGLYLFSLYIKSIKHAMHQAQYTNASNLLMKSFLLLVSIAFPPAGLFMVAYSGFKGSTREEQQKNMKSYERDNKAFFEKGLWVPGKQTSCYKEAQLKEENYKKYGPSGKPSEENSKEQSQENGKYVSLEEIYGKAFGEQPSKDSNKSKEQSKQKTEEKIKESPAQSQEKQESQKKQSSQQTSVGKESSTTGKRKSAYEKWEEVQCEEVDKWFHSKDAESIIRNDSQVKEDVVSEVTMTQEEQAIKDINDAFSYLGKVAVKDVSQKEENMEAKKEQGRDINYLKKILVNAESKSGSYGLDVYSGVINGEKQTLCFCPTALHDEVRDNLKAILNSEEAGKIVMVSPEDAVKYSNVVNQETKGTGPIQEHIDVEKIWYNPDTGMLSKTVDLFEKQKEQKEFQELITQAKEINKALANKLVENNEKGVSEKMQYHKAATINNNKENIFLEVNGAVLAKLTFDPKTGEQQLSLTSEAENFCLETESGHMSVRDILAQNDGNPTSYIKAFHSIVLNDSNIHNASISHEAFRRENGLDQGKSQSKSKGNTRAKGYASKTPAAGGQSMGGR